MTKERRRKKFSDTKFRRSRAQKSWFCTLCSSSKKTQQFCIAFYLLTVLFLASRAIMTYSIFEVIFHPHNVKTIFQYISHFVITSQNFAISLGHIMKEVPCLFSSHYVTFLRIISRVLKINSTFLLRSQGGAAVLEMNWRQSLLSI
jgi:hypothetical protein